MSFYHTHSYTGANPYTGANTRRGYDTNIIWFYVHRDANHSDNPDYTDHSDQPTNHRDP